MAYLAREYQIDEKFERGGYEGRCQIRVAYDRANRQTIGWVRIEEIGGKIGERRCELLDVNRVYDLAVCIEDLIEAKIQEILDEWGPATYPLAGETDGS